MKRGIFLVLALFMMVSTVEANNGNRLTNRVGFNYSYNDAVNFVERGIEFFVFTNGEFDFDTRFRNRGVRIQRDFRGRVRRVGNVFINYDFRENVTRIGNVFMRYRRGRLANVGNLSVRYDRWGFPLFYGNVGNDFYYHNGVRFNIGFGDVCNYNDRFFFSRDFRRNYSQIREDRNFYYYRANPNARIGKRSEILRRRKPAAKAFNNRETNRRDTNSVRKSENNTVRRNSTSVRKRSTHSYRKSEDNNTRTKRKSDNTNRRRN